MDEPPEKEKQEKNEGGRRMRQGLMDSEEIGKIVDQRKREDKKQKAPPGIKYGESQNRKEDGCERRLERFDQGDIVEIKKEQADGVENSEDRDGPFYAGDRAG